MIITFRADASIEIGTGHVMRCLALADVLRSKGAECVFLCRSHSGHLMESIRRQGHDVVALSALEQPDREIAASPYALWLGTDWKTDSRQSQVALGGRFPAWIVVDHYALDRSWEEAMRPYCGRIMVIDDLANRPHSCDLLLDPNLGRVEADYSTLVGAFAERLIGPRYALLRGEFALWRNYSLTRRRAGKIENLLIAMGGVDSGNATGQILDALHEHSCPGWVGITVVLGSQSPWKSDVMARASAFDGRVTLLSNISNMAELMSNCDLAIGAAGGMAWERCALGLPSLLLVLAENQREGAAALQRQNCCLVSDNVESLVDSALRFLFDQSANEQLTRMSAAASRVTRGDGAELVAARMCTANG